MSCLPKADVEPLRAQLRDYFAKGERPTAVYSLFLKGTLVALSEFRRRGWHCPNDISLVGFDDAEWMQVTWPAIAAVVQPVRQIAGHAMEALFARIEGEEGPPTARLEPCQVLMRESVGSPGNGPHSGEETDNSPHCRSGKAPHLALARGTKHQPEENK